MLRGTRKGRPTGGGLFWSRRRVSSESLPEASGRPSAQREEVPLGYSTPAAGTTSEERSSITFPRFPKEPRKLHIRCVLPPLKIGPTTLGSDFAFLRWRLAPKTLYRFVAPPYQIGPASLGSDLGLRGGLFWSRRRVSSKSPAPQKDVALEKETASGKPPGNRGFSFCSLLFAAFFRQLTGKPFSGS